MSSDLSGLYYDVKSEDVLGNLKVFVLGVGCWVSGGGGLGRENIYDTRRFCHGFLWVNIDDKKCDSCGKFKVFVR